MKRGIIIKFVCAAMLISLALTSCSGSKNMTADGDYPAADAPGGGYYDESYTGKPEEAEPSGVDIEAAAERKRIEYVTIRMQTLDFDRTVDELQARTEASGGYVESSEVSGASVYESGSRYARFVFRVPAVETGSFTSSVCSLGTVLSQSTTSDDVTASYFDIEARLASLEMQRDKYMELLDSAEDMYVVVELTKALSDVIYEIESYTTTKNRYDSLIAYSTVTVYVDEVGEYTEPKAESFSGRVASAFNGSVKAFVSTMQWIGIAIAAAAPFLAVPVAIAAAIGIAFAIRHRRGKRRGAKNKREE